MDERAKFQKRFDELSQENIQALITELNKAIGSYISRGGISQDPNNNPDYNTIVKLTKQAEDIKNRYASLNDDITKHLTTQAKDNDLAGLLKENGELQKQIGRLEKIQSDMKIDVVSAVARDELLRSRSTDITRHQLFILDRPIRPRLVPYLWVLTILFIGVGLVIFKMTLPSFQITSTNSQSQISTFSMIYEFLTSKIILGSLFGSALIVILFLSLKIAGVFGK